MFGNGGADTLDVGSSTSLTAIGGQGGDSIRAGASTQLVFGNEGNDTINLGANSETVFGGQGNDCVLGGGGRGSLQGNEGSDSISGGAAIDTIAGGSGNDVFTYGLANEDGNNAAGGGPLEQITDVNWAEDKVDTATQVTFAINVGAGTGVDLNASANNAIVGAFGLAGGGANVVAAQFTFAGRTYLAIDQANTGTLRRRRRPASRHHRRHRHDRGDEFHLNGTTPANASGRPCWRQLSETSRMSGLSRSSRQLRDLSDTQP